MPLLHSLDVWYRRGNLGEELQRQNTLSHFGHEFWHCLLAGFGTFPAVIGARSDAVDCCAAQGIGPLPVGCSMNFPLQSEALDKQKVEVE